MKCPNCDLPLTRQGIPNDFLWLCEQDGTVVDERYCDFPEVEAPLLKEPQWLQDAREDLGCPIHGNLGGENYCPRC